MDFSGDSTLGAGNPTFEKEGVSETSPPNPASSNMEPSSLLADDNASDFSETNKTVERSSHRNGSEEPLLTNGDGSSRDFTVSSSAVADETGHRQWWNLRCCSICNLVLSLLAAVLTGTFPLIFHTIMNYELSLQSGSSAYKMWTDPPIPIYMRFYMFNISNVQEVLDSKAKPALKELGPYTFREWHQRVKVEQYDNSTMKFQQIRTWHFVPEMSNGSLDDNVTSLNVPLMTAAYGLRDFPVLVRFLFNQVARDFGFSRFITQPVGKLLFDGYYDKLLNLSSKLPPELFPTVDKFGWFYGRNGSDTYDGVFSIYSGASDISRVGEMDMWNLTRQNKFYDSYCGRVNGSFGEAFPPRRTKTNITLYTTDLCRSITLDYKEEVDHFGVTANRYYGSPLVFDNGTLNDENRCFCVRGECHPSGVVDSSTCRLGAPAFVSFPHFLYGDPSYLRQVDGLDPQEDLHQFHIDLEPETGIPVSVNARLQISILMDKVSHISITENITRTYLPMFWFSMNAEVDASLASSIKLTINLPFIGTMVCFVVFSICLLSASVCTYTAKKRSAKVAISPN